MTTTLLLQCAEQGPKETFADTKLCEARSIGEEGKKSQRNPLNINLDFSQVNYVYEQSSSQFWTETLQSESEY